jgi:hypothetical protein
MILAPLVGLVVYLVGLGAALAIAAGVAPALFAVAVFTVNPVWTLGLVALVGFIALAPLVFTSVVMGWLFS